ncbi:MAG: methionyl-tRNA formyltransferase [Dehalococcoidales bacterium]|nr:methionyl-tRNA formyltransferase [Dehalococcoidales bacterium]
MRIVFMGSPAFAVPSLERLVRDGYQVVAAYTQPDRPAGRGRNVVRPPVKDAAERLGIPVLQPESLKAEDTLARLASFKPDAITVCAYGQILTQDVIDMPPWQCLNVHFSLLPRHRGASPVASAILAGDEVTGVTVQLVRKKLDTGPLLAAASIPILPRDTTRSLTEKLSVVGANLLSEALGGWIRGERQPREQDEARYTYSSQIKKEDGRIDWNLPAETIWRQVRAYYPWPGSYTMWKGKQLKILAADVAPVGGGEPGRVVSLDDAPGIGIVTGKGILRIYGLQLEGKREMASKEFLSGHADIIGAILPS